jgi:GNAT superfamily N-acetyltransferase
MEKKMEIYEGLGFEPMKESDVECLAPIMKAAFNADAKLHLGQEAGGPPGYDNGDFLRKWYFENQVHAYVIKKDGTPIGGVNVFDYNNGEGYLGNMFIDPTWANQGFGHLTWQYIEQKHPKIVKWKTDTPKFAKRNLYFYIEKCGFKATNLDDSNEFCFLEKIIENHLNLNNE